MLWGKKSYEVLVEEIGHGLIEEQEGSHRVLRRLGIKMGVVMAMALKGKIHDQRSDRDFTQGSFEFMDVSEET
jgi:hypothetical protein